jgi:CIC family chloride channel protein
MSQLRSARSASPLRARRAGLLLLTMSSRDRKSRGLATLDRVDAALRRLGVNDYTLFLLLAGIVGLAAGAGVVLFRMTYESITRLVLPGADGHSVVEVIRHRPPWTVVASVAGGGLLVALIHRLRHGHHFHGVAQIIDSVAFRGGRIPFVMTAVRFLTNALSIGAGASVGPEGPVIELGSGLGSAHGQALGLSPERVRTLVGAGAAAGLAAAFNAPIAGAIFVLEVILKDFAVVTFGPILVASVLSTALSRALLGDSPAFVVPGYELGSAQELPLYVLLGGLAGVWGALFTRGLDVAPRWFARIPGPRPLVTAGTGAVLGLAVLALPELWGVGYEPITDMLHGRIAWSMLLLLVVAKLVATTASVSSGFAGGIIAPILFMGGALGGVFGQFVQRIMPQSSSATGAYGLVGMAALTAAVTHAPLTSILLLFEMTGGYEVILPLMLSCISAVVVAQAISRDSAFTTVFSAAGIDVNIGRESAILRDLYVQDIMRTDPPVVRVDTRFGDILDGFLTQSHDSWFVVDQEDALRGVINLHDIKSVLQQQGLRWVVIADDVMQPADEYVRRRDNLEDAISVLSQGQEGEIPVIEDEGTRRLVGTLHRADVLELYNREVLHRDIIGIKLARQDSRDRDVVGLPSEYRVEVVPVPGDFGGRTLAELDLRGRYGIHVLAVKSPARRGTERNELPDPTATLLPAQRLVIVGRHEDLARLRGDAGIA